MDNRHRVYIVDVFAEQPYAGNPLAVVVGSTPLPDQTMQQIAAEINFSETTFVIDAPNASGAYPVRVFTPAREIAFTGHPILGTAWVIRNNLLSVPANHLHLDLALGVVPVSFESTMGGEEVAWFKAPEITLGEPADPKLMAKALGISPDAIDDSAPIQQLSAGTSAMIVPVHTLEAVEDARLDLEAYAPLAAKGFPPLTYLFCRQTRNPENDIHARFFFEAFGVREDPATGNGAAFLGAYLLEHRLFSAEDLSLRIEQGHQVQRPSLIMLRAGLAGATAVVEVGGRVIPVMKGELC